MTTDSSSSSFESGSSPRAAASLTGSGAAPDLMASRMLLEMAVLLEWQEFSCEGKWLRVRLLNKITIRGAVVQSLLAAASASSKRNSRSALALALDRAMEGKYHSRRRSHRRMRVLRSHLAGRVLAHVDINRYPHARDRSWFVPIEEVLNEAVKKY